MMYVHRERYIDRDGNNSQRPHEKLLFMEELGYPGGRRMKESLQGLVQHACSGDRDEETVTRLCPGEGGAKAKAKGLSSE